MFIFGSVKSDILKITGVEYWKEELGLTRPYAVTYVMHDSVDNIFIKILCEEGIVGLGAGSPSMHVTGEIMDTNFDARRSELEEMLVGQDIRHLFKLTSLVRDKYNKSPGLCAAIDMALYDAFCKKINVPLLHFLGAKIKPLPTSVTIGIKNVEETVAEGIEYKGLGYTIIKLKIGHDHNEDIERFVKLRAAVGSAMLIRVDANQGFNTEEFKAFYKETEKYQVEFFEQPFKPKQPEQMLSLNKELRDLCAADEDLHTSVDAVLYACDPKPFGIYNIKLMKSGGITEARKIASVAHNFGVELMWGCMDESKISISAALNTAMSCSATRYLDLDGSLDLARDVVSGGFNIKDGVLYPELEKPGLGVDLLV